MGTVPAGFPVRRQDGGFPSRRRLRQFLGMSSALVLNVAGPRESKVPGIQTRAKAFLEVLLWEA